MLIGVALFVEFVLTLVFLSIVPLAKKMLSIVNVSHRWSVCEIDDYMMWRMVYNNKLGL
jgi:hypothetical protein